MNDATVLLTRPMPAAAAETLQEADLRPITLDSESPPAREDVLAAVRGCAGAITMLSDRVDEGFLEAAGPTLRVVANYAVGFDNIDLDACRRRGVRVTNTPGVLTEATADLTWALILAASRRVVEGDALVRSGRWTGWAPTLLRGLELCGATMGILGAGRIGTAVARRAAGFGMRILYTSTHRNDTLERDLGAERVELDRLVRAADVLTLHVPMRPENHHLIGAAELAAMKPGAILINTARGAVIDEAALVEALAARRIAAAGLDVYENEPELAPGLAELSNVVVLPHLGSATHATRDRMARMAAENVVAVLAGRAPPNAVA